MKLCVLIGSADISGGTYVVFEHALYLQAHGHDVTIVALEPLAVAAQGWHRGLSGLTFRTVDDVRATRFDIVIATWWKTVYQLPRIQAGKAIYFVQSIESWFYLDSDVAVRNLVNATYLLPMPVITEARWIRDHLTENFALDVRLAPNGCAKALYGPLGEAVSLRMPGRLRVLVEGPLAVDFKNVARSIALVTASAAHEIWLLTSSPITRYPGVARVFSRVPVERCAAIYRSCDVLVKLSTIEGMFGPPLEMFHCGGTAIVYNVTGHSEYIRHERNALVIESGDEAAVIAAINRLARDPNLLDRLKREALVTAGNWPDWPDASRVFETQLEQLARAPGPDQSGISVRIGEYWRQYLRVETALAGRRPRRGRLIRLITALRRRSRRFDELVHIAHAWLLERRRLPAPRTRI